jgi:hypothetical protein
VDEVFGIRTGAAIPGTPDRLRLQPLNEAPPPAPLAVYAGAEHLATIASPDHADVSAIIDTGLAVDLSIVVDAEPPALTISLPFTDTE